MRNEIRKMVGLLCTMLLVISSISVVNAEIPSEYWKYQQQFLQAVDNNNEAEIISLGTQIMQVFKDKPLDKDKAGILYSTYDKMYPVYETQENYDMAVKCLQAMIPYGEYLKFDDGVKLAKARIKKIDPMTEVYALTKSNNLSPYFGMKNEPKNGTYFGRVFTQDGIAPMDNETAISFYVECFNESISDYDYLIRNYSDGSRVVHIALNMPNENDSLKMVMSSESDNYLYETANYINSLGTPVLLRIGGEMNVWSNIADAELYKNAFIKISKIMREYAPNAAMVFSPNDISNWAVDIDDYYPGDENVDWVGVSLYTNKFRNYQIPQKGKDFEEMYYGNGIYANPISKLRDIVERYGDKKPIIITEGGSGHSVTNGSLDLTSFAGNSINVLYSYANMVFPQVKGIIYFDVDLNRDGYVYSLKKNSTVMSQYNTAVSNNRTLISDLNETPYSYVKAGMYRDNMPNVELYTYCGIPDNSTLRVIYTLDKNNIESQTVAPYKCVMSSESISVGVHDLEVSIKGNKYEKLKKYTFEKLNDGNVIIREMK